MLGFELTGTNAAIAMLVIVAITFIQFIREKHPPEVVAIGSAAVMMLLGLLPVKDAASVLSNAAPWTIAFMFLIMGGLLRNGALEMMSRAVSAHATDRPVLTVCALFGVVILSSAIMNNTPVVAVMIPIGRHPLPERISRWRWRSISWPERMLSRNILLRTIWLL